MMTKYHVNPETGKVSMCRAKVKCRFGGTSGSENHFSSKNDADNAAEGLMASKYSSSNVSRTKSDFVSVRENIKKGLIASGIIPNASALPHVNSKAEMIEKWFGGDRNKFEVISRISDPKSSLKAPERKSLGKMVSSGIDVSVAKDSNFASAPSVLGSDIELIDDLPEGKIDMKDLASGKLKAF